VYRSYRARIAVLLVVLVVTGCAKQKSISRDELRSQLKEIHATAFEAMLFLGQVRGHKITSTFAAAHIHYLHETNQEVVSDLSGSSLQSGPEVVLAESHASAEELSKILRGLASSIDKPAMIENATKRLDEIAQHTQQLEASF
jgi:hypothetical protein